MRQKTHIELPHGYDPRLLLWCFFIMSSVPSCGICKNCPSQKDSIRIEYRDRIIHDTTTFEVRKEVEKIVTRDTMSHLENSWAKSDALVSDGFLHHSLESIPQIIKVPYEVVVTDTLIIEKTTEPQYIEKPLTWWQRFRQGAFWWLVGGIALLLLWTFRKSIFKIV